MHRRKQDVVDNLNRAACIKLTIDELFDSLRIAIHDVVVNRLRRRHVQARIFAVLRISDDRFEMLDERRERVLVSIVNEIIGDVAVFFGN